jgi:hypothetical protein
MNQLRSRTRLRLFASALVLLIVALVGAACGSKATPAAPTQAPAPTQAAAPQATQPAAGQPTVAPAPVQQESQDAGPSLSKNPAAAIARHYQGDPNAPVVLIEISDFQ